MSFQSGIRYFDGRAISTPEIARVLNGLRSEDSPAAAYHLQPGLLLAHSGGKSSLIHTITFDGRLDNRDDLILQLNDALLGDTSDASLALAAYQRWAAEGLARLIGDWSLVIWDGVQKAILLASDFAGVRPLYYCSQPNRLSWSTRLAALAPDTGVDLDDEYVATLLGSAPPDNRTPYRGIRSVPPGHAVRVTAGAISIERFWTPPVGNTIRYQRPADYDERLRALFQDAVRCRLRNKTSVLCDLSGGFDSSSVVSMARRLSDNLRLITITLEHDESIDTPFYTRMEDFCRTEPVHIATRNHKFLSETLTGGAAPAPWQGLHTHVASVARERGASVYMTGQAGDFIMGNRWDDSVQLLALVRRGRIPSALQASLAWSKTLRIPIYWVLWKALLGHGADSPSVAPGPRPAPERRQHFFELSQILNSRRLQPPEPLEHLEYTHPYAHRPLVEFMMSIPPEVVCGPGEPRRLMRRAFDSLWPPGLRKRHSKDSFGGVLLETLRPLAANLSQNIQRLEVVQRGYVEAKSLEQRLNRLARALDCDEPQLRQVILLELWLRRRTSQSSSNPCPSPPDESLPKRTVAWGYP